MILYFILAVIGSVLLLYGRRKHKILLSLGILLVTAGLFMLASALLLTGSIRNSESNPGPDDPRISSTGGTVGQDWRTWRSYSEDFLICDQVKVCLSPLDGGAGYGVYDSGSGERIGTLSANDVGGQEKIRCEDLDGDGLNELGIVCSDEILWYHYIGETWSDGEGGGCFEQI